MMVAVGYYTDPLCPWSWAAEPVLRRLMVEFAGELQWTFVMAGLERDLLDGRRPGAGIEESRCLTLVEGWLRVAAHSGAPLDPLLWRSAPPSSSYPACMAALAAGQQSDDGGYRYLRVLREGLMCRRHPLDRADALIDLARELGLDEQRFAIELRSHETVERFGADLERTRALAANACGGADRASVAQGVPLPAIAFKREGEVRERLFGLVPYQTCRDAAISAGAKLRKDEPLSIEDAFERFPTLTTPEVELLCDLPRPRAAARLFWLSEQGQLRQERVLTGSLWSRVP
jgi:predicted DsbA family dithiol-disulfide isomerase